MLINDWFNKGHIDNHVFVIAEIAQNHDGSLGQAHAYIDAVAETGADAIKFQTHIADAESTPYEPFRVKFSYEDDTRYAYWKRMEFTFEQWKGLYDHAKEKGLEFLSSPFSEEAVCLLDKVGIAAWKIGSGEVFNKPMLKKMVQTQKPILLSSGMSTYKDIDEQIKVIGSVPYAIFQCTTAYPCPLENIGLNIIEEMREKYRCPIGFSDHSGTIFPSLAAVAKGATMIEVHATMSQYMFGPDVKSSLSIEKMQEMISGIRMISRMINTPVDKSSISKEMNVLKTIFSKGIYLKRDMKIGEKILLSDISFKKPLQGIQADDYEKLIGKKLKQNLLKDSPLHWSDLE